MNSTDKLEPKDKKPSKSYLYFVAITVNILAFSAGVAFAWTSPAIPKMNGVMDPEHNPLATTLTHQEESWLTSLLHLGTSIGPFVFGFLSDKIGRKKTLMISSIPIIIMFALKAFAHVISHFYIARFVGGLGLGAVFTTIPMYIGEIAEDKNRGTLGCIMPVFLTIGILFTYCVGPFLTIMWFNIINIVPLIVFLPLMVFYVPNSPYYLIANNQRSQAEIALRMVRGRPSIVDTDKEMSVIVENVRQSFANPIHPGDLFKSTGLRKGIVITFGLMFFQQFSGISVLLSYMQDIFEKADSSLSSELAVIIIGFVQFFSCTVTSCVVDKLGRKLLLLISMLGTALTNCIMGVYFYLLSSGSDTQSYSWIPIASLVVFMIAYNLGIGPLPWALLGELFPPHMKARASTLTTFVCLILAFSTNMAFPYVREHVGIAEIFWFFSACCAVGLVFVFAIVKETKGKSLHDIQVMLGR